MTDRFAVDTSAVIDLLRTDRSSPPLLRGSAAVFLPLPALGELYAGALRSQFRDRNLEALSAVRRDWVVLSADEPTARIYGHLRANRLTTAPRSEARLAGAFNDLWIAALCLQHKLPLLSNDRDFDGIEGLEVIHW
jgi:tRNA(fMet)-specific endonuclease VapC